MARLDASGVRELRRQAATWGCLTDVPGIEVGHYSDLAAGTGSTVVIARGGFIGGIDVRGAYPGLRDTAMLDPLRTPVSIHALCLSGGSTFGLAAADGVVAWLEGKGIGNRVGQLTIPRVPTAVVFDLGVGDPYRRPGYAEGVSACDAASNSPSPQGTVGAGTGAAVGKLQGMKNAMKGGFGTASIELGDGVVVGAAMVVNAVGSIHCPDTGQILAGPLDDVATPGNSVEILLSREFIPPPWLAGSNTVIGVVATNATIGADDASRMAAAGQAGLATVIRPIQMAMDGDTVFGISTGSGHHAQGARLQAAAGLASVRAAIRAVIEAQTICGIRSFEEINA